MLPLSQCLAACYVDVINECAWMNLASMISALALINVMPTTTLVGSFVTMSIDTISASPDEGGKASRRDKSTATILPYLECS